MNQQVHPAQFLFTKDHPLTSRLNMEFTERVDGLTKVYVEAPAEFAEYRW